MNEFILFINRLLSHMIAAEFVSDEWFQSQGSSKSRLSVTLPSFP